MGTTYKTKDGFEFNDQGVAQDHANKLAKDEAARDARIADKVSHNMDVAEEELRPQLEWMLDVKERGRYALFTRDIDTAIEAFTKLLAFKFQSSNHDEAIRLANAYTESLRKQDPLFRRRLALAYAHRGFYKKEHENNDLDGALEDYKQMVDLIGPNGGPPGWMVDRSLWGDIESYILNIDFKPDLEWDARIAVAIASIDYQWTYDLLQENDYARDLLAELFYREGRIVAKDVGKANALLEGFGEASKRRVWAKDLWKNNPPAAKTRSKPLKTAPALEFLEGGTPSGNTQTVGASSAVEDKTHGMTGYVVQIIFALIGSGVLGSVGGRLLKGIPLIGPYLGIAGSLAGVIIGFTKGGPAKSAAAYQDYKRKPFRNTILLLALIVVMVVPKIDGLFSRAVNLVAGWVDPSAVTAPAPSAASTATVTSDALNLRSEPSASGALLKTLKKGDTLTITGDAANGWTPVEYDGAKGYVSAQYIKIE
ncbi:hypothetical protein FACS189468_2240 [Spirochaetia bacterium]|nr:hypothetical protein FACS189468_2240 [Spirochaetia bacterium]